MYHACTRRTLRPSLHMIRPLAKVNVDVGVLCDQTRACISSTSPGRLRIRKGRVTQSRTRWFACTPYGGTVSLRA